MASRGSLTPTAPAWFKAERYETLLAACRGGPRETQSREVWLSALNRCWALREWSDEEWSQKAEFISEPFPAPDGSPATFGPGNDLLPPPVMAFERAQMDESWFDLFGPSILIRVSLAAPDATIRKGIRRELESARAVFPSLVKRPGPPAPNSEFTRQTFCRWWNARIVHVAELDWWNARQAKRCPAAQLARWVFGNAGQTRHMIASRRVLALAIRSRDALAFELRSGPKPTAQ